MHFMEKKYLNLPSFSLFIMQEPTYVKHFTSQKFGTERFNRAAKLPLFELKWGQQTSF